MTHKRIGIDARLIYQSGVGVYTRNLLSNIARLENSTHEYFVFAKASEWERFLKEYNIDPRKFQLRESNVRWHTFQEQFVFLIDLYRSNLDLVHFTYFSWPILYFRPFVATVHDTILLTHPTGRASKLPTWIYWVKQFVFQFVFGEQVRRAMRIFVPSETVKNELVGFYPKSEDKIVVTKEGVDEVFARSVAQKPAGFPYDPKSYLLYVGNCYPHKNVDLLLEALNQSKEQGAKSKEIRLVLAGPRSIFADELKEKYISLGDRVLWLHDVRVGELKWLYSNAKSLVFPSKAEGFGFPIVEAQSVGCRLILSDIPVFHEIAGDNAKYFPTGDVSTLTKNLFCDNSQDESAKSTSSMNEFALMTALTIASYSKITNSGCSTN